MFQSKNLLKKLYSYIINLGLYAVNIGCLSQAILIRCYTFTDKFAPFLGKNLIFVMSAK